MGEIMVGLPSIDDTINAGLSAALMGELRQKGAPALRLVHLKTSLLANGFNQLWCIALNNRHMLSHFLMLHSDIVPTDAGFVKILLDEMEQVGADVLSAVVPLKSETGITSTAIIPDLAWAHALSETVSGRRRLTMQELERMPQTFDAAMVAEGLEMDGAEPALLVNTGMLLVDLRKPWVERVHFTINDALWQRADGKFVCDVEPEDWFFSSRAAEEGARVWATRKVKVEHVGSKGYSNQGAWGTLEHDVIG
jgi:hypothetical protein